MDTVILTPRRRTAEIDSAMEVATAREMVAKSWNTLDVEAACPGLRLQPKALVTVTGPPGAGKSTLALRIANCSKRPVAVLAAEERLGAAVGERLSRLGIHRADYHIVGRTGSVDDMTRFCRKQRVAILVIDSITATTHQPSDLRSFISYLDLDLLIAVAQVNKKGAMRGTRELEHESDVVIEVESGEWSVTKTRFGVTGQAGKVAFDVRKERPDTREEAPVSP